MINNKPHDLKNQETLCDRNKMGYLNLFSKMDAHAMFTYRKSKRMFKKRL